MVKVASSLKAVFIMFISKEEKHTLIYFQLLLRQSGMFEFSCQGGWKEEESIPAGWKDADKHSHVHPLNKRGAADKDDEREGI
jgi:hypothetical protein